MEKVGRPMKGYQAMNQEAQGAATRLQSENGPSETILSGSVGNNGTSGGGGGGGGRGSVGAGVSFSVNGLRASSVGADGVPGGGSSSRRSVLGNQGQPPEVAMKIAEASNRAGHFIKEQLQLMPTRQRQGMMGEPLLSTSQGSLKEVRLAEAAAAARDPAATNGVSVGGGSTVVTFHNPGVVSDSRTVSFDHHAPPSHLRKESQAAACYSHPVSESNGDLSNPQPVISKHSNTRYQPTDYSNRNANDDGAGSSKALDERLHMEPSLHRSSSGSNRQGSVITFRNINYEVMVKRYPWSKAEKKVVLNGVSGIMRPGLNAIMGPTGSGKSSLLDVLAGRKDPQYLRGEVLVDGCEQPHNFKCMSGYVVQDDIVMGTLTVRENLSFSAALRLPGNTSRDVRKEKVESVIRELGLTKVANSKIGTELIRGVSGGERKRTNIGMELITDPTVLFLDEPTTGLDAFTAGSVIRTLKLLANSGRTIIFSIHQPKYSIYRLFDNLTLVVAGNVIYHGKAGNEPLGYFDTVGYQCEAHNSPPDFFMDMVHGEITLKKGSRDNLDELVKRDSLIDTEVQKTQSEAVSNQLIESWRNSGLSSLVDQQVDDIYQHSLRQEGASAGVKIKKAARIEYPTGLWNQIVWVSWRTGLNLFRNPQSSIIQLAVYLFFALSIGTVFYNLDMSDDSGVRNRQGLFFFLILQMVFVNLGAIEVFIKERVIFIHENSSGFYRVSVYFMAKIVCDMLPIKTLPVLLFMPIVYFMAKLKLSAGAFFFYELNLVLATCAACGVAFFISASVSVFGIANIFISIIYVFMMVFSGFLRSIASMGDWLSWCKYLSVFNYAYAGLSANEFVGLEFCKIDEKNVTRTCRSGIEILSGQQISYNTAWDMWYNELGMLLITLFFLALCYIQLRRINKYK